MASYFKNTTTKMGTAPGSHVFVGTKRIEQVHIDAFRFDKNELETFYPLTPHECPPLLQKGKVVWYNVTGLHDASLISQFGELFGLHPLLTEDVLNTTQRPKMDVFDDHLAFLVHMLTLNAEKQGIVSEQLALVVGDGYIISFQEAPGDVFDPIRKRILQPTTKIRHRGSDYLAFAMLDAVVDHYIVCIEFIGTQVEELESQIFNAENKHIVRHIARMRREITDMRRSVRPVIELVSKFERHDGALISSKTLPFIRDLHGHVLQAAEALEVYNELVSDAFMTFTANGSNRLNEIIRVLTVISVIFMPLTFIAGVYGANFEYMPELGYRYAYPIFWVVLVLSAAVMVIYFKRKRWL